MRTFYDDGPEDWTEEEDAEYDSIRVRLAATYAALNDEHFGGNLPFVSVTPGIPDDRPGHESLNGFTRTNCILRRSDIGGLETITEDQKRQWFGGPSRYTANSEIYVSEWLFNTPAADEDVRWRMITEELLHEMVHVLIARKYGRRGGNHGARFTNECNAIGQRMGWEDVVTVGSWDDEEWNTSIHWPRSDDNEVTDALHVTSVTGKLVRDHGWTVEAAYATASQVSA